MKCGQETTDGKQSLKNIRSDSFPNVSMNLPETHCWGGQGWIDGRKKWKKYEMIRDLGIAFFGALMCCIFSEILSFYYVFTLALGQGTANVMG